MSIATKLEPIERSALTQSVQMARKFTQNRDITAGRDVALCAVPCFKLYHPKCDF